MTLSVRNIVFKGGIILSLFFLLLCIAASVKVLPVYPTMEQDIGLRSSGLFHVLVEKTLNAKLLAVHCCIAVSVLYSFLTIILIYFSFEKTQSPEILFVAFFAAAFAPETLRLIIPLGRVYDIPSLYSLLASRVILFCRCFGIFSLFAASMYASGFKSQRQRNVIIIRIVTALFIAIGVPIDTLAWDSGLNMVSGYTSMFLLIEIGTFLFSTGSFFIAAWSRGSREYAYIGAGSVLLFLGRNILLNADTWVGSAAGPVCLLIGTWLICQKLHKVYLWL
jgi:hypothetical protein